MHHWVAFLSLCLLALFYIRKSETKSTEEIRENFLFTCNQYKAHIDTEINPEPLVKVSQLLLFFHVNCAIANNCIGNQLTCNICHFISWAVWAMPGSNFCLRRRVFRVRVIFLYVARGMVNSGAKVYVIGGGGRLVRNLDKKKIVIFDVICLYVE